MDEILIVDPEKRTVDWLSLAGGEPALLIPKVERSIVEQARRVALT